MHPLMETLLARYPDLEGCADDILRATSLLAGVFRHEGKLLLCGNGGSASDSEHIVGELMKGFLQRRPVPSDVRARLQTAGPDDGLYLANNLQGALPAISLNSHTALMTAVSNDIAADMVFAQQVYGYGRPNDVVLGISTSGTSKNVCRAFQVGRALGLHTIGLTGASGGRFPELCDIVIHVPYHTVVEIQERHLPIYHVICSLLEEELFHA